MLQIYQMLREEKVYTGKEIKTAILKDIEDCKGSIAKEVFEFYVNYVRGELYFPLADTGKYKLEICGHNIEAVSMCERV